MPHHVKSKALSHLRICDFTGQLAGAGATKFMAAFGAEVIRIEDPSNHGRWDILRGMPPYVDDRRGPELGGPFNNHNVGKLGISLNIKTEKGRELFERLVAISDCVTENFSSGVMRSWGYDYDALKQIREDIIYVSNCGFGHSGPYEKFKTWGPIVQATSGLTMSSAIPDQPPAGWGYSYMDHTGAYFMAMAIMLAIHHRNRTGEGQYVDVAATEAALTLNGPVLLDYTVNGRPLRRDGYPDANHSQFPAMAPHNIYAAKPVPGSFDEAWIAIACRNDEDWHKMRDVLAADGCDWASNDAYGQLSGRLAAQDELDSQIAEWCLRRDPFQSAEILREAGVPANAVQTPEQRIDQDVNSSEARLWPTIRQAEMGRLRVDGIPAHFTKTDWSMTRGAATLGEDNDYVYGELLGLSQDEIAGLHEEGVI